LTIVSGGVANKALVGDSSYSSILSMLVAPRFKDAPSKS